ncbi:MAG: hypothetical protein NWF05_10650 [Candidatus Bathyarchaeota archaeon]|nr:hypothetical protein [Candidatus Bathyarchaeota archaeon]
MPKTPDTDNTETNNTYNALKQLLTANNCRITNQIPPTTITAIHGSIWGTTPKTAKKTLTFTLTQDNTDAHVAGTAHLTASYKQFTLVGIVFSMALLALCTWIATDLQSPSQTSFWSWLAQTNGQLDPAKTATLATLTTVLAAFLAGTLAIEACILWKVHTGINAFAENLAKTLHN